MAVVRESRDLTSGSPSPSPSTGSNFRELDDAFLQSQTRLWLGEVLQIRFDEDMNIGDLLADGELLLEVSEVLSRMLPTLCADMSHMKANEGKSAAISKSTRRYLPYYNVGSFLRMCKHLGLDGIDLFDPSDVVEKRNTRKVCMCIRSLSKKVRSRDLNITVPDFDSVTCTLSMPTDMVECIRKSLELSQSSTSPSVGPDSGKVSRVRYWQKISNSTSAQSNGYSDNCDEAESSFMVPESYGSSDDPYDPACLSNPGSQMVTDNGSEALKLQLNTEDLENEEDEQCEYLSPSIAESVGSFCSQYYSDQEPSSMPSSPGLGSCVNGKVLEVEAENGCRNGDMTHVLIDWEDSSLNGGIFIDGNADNGETDHVSCDKEDVDSTCFDGGYPTWENKSCNGHIEKSAHCSKIECEKGSPDDIQQGDCKYSISDGSPVQRPEEEQLDNGVAKDEMENSALSPEIGISSSDGKLKDDNLSNEHLIQSTGHVSSPTKTPDCSSYGDENHESQISAEIVNIGGNANCSNLGPIIVAQSLASAQFIHDRDKSSFTDIQNENEAFDNNVITYDLSSHPDNHCMGDNPSDFTEKPDTGFNSIPYTVGATESKPCSEDNHDNQEVSEEHNDQVESINGKPIDKEEPPFHSGDDFVGGNGSDSLDMPDKNLNSLPSVTETMDIVNSLDDKGSGAYDVTVEGTNGKPIDVENANSMDSSASILSTSLSGAETPECIEDTVHKHQQCAENLVKGETDHNHTDKEMSQSQPWRKLLKSVVKGTALVGIAVFVLHLRKYAKANLPRAKKQPVEALIRNRPKSPRQMGQKGASISSVYPAEKLKLI